MKLAAMTIGAMLALALTGCAGSRAAPASPPPVSAWREVATPEDRGRIREWRTAWVAALAKARGAGHDAAIAREAVLLEPDAALPIEVPPPGPYRCRVIKMGAKSQGMLDYVAYPAFDCRIAPKGSLLGFAKLTGSQRPIGLLYPDTPRRMIFLGTLQLGDEKMALRYASDQERDVAGLLERIGERRWRLVLPYPNFESTIDVVELLPRA